MTKTTKSKAIVEFEEFVSRFLGDVSFHYFTSRNVLEVYYEADKFEVVEDDEMLTPIPILAFTTVEEDDFTAVMFSDDGTLDFYNIIAKDFQMLAECLAKFQSLVSLGLVTEDLADEVVYDEPETSEDGLEVEKLPIFDEGAVITQYPCLVNLYKTDGIFAQTFTTENGNEESCLPTGRELRDSPFVADHWLEFEDSCGELYYGR